MVMEAQEQLVAKDNPHPKYCQEIVKLTKQQCRNRVYSLTELPAKDSPTGERLDLYLCRLHFSFHLNSPAFRTYASWPVDHEHRDNMQLLFDLHDRTKP